MSDELAFMLERVSRHFKEAPRDVEPKLDQLATLEKSIKRKRISKRELIDILRTIRPGPSLGSESSTVRGLLKQFLEAASLAQEDKLMSILDTNGKVDPYLKGISER